MQLSGYTIVKELYRSETSLIFRCERKTDGKFVIIKILNLSNPTPQQVSLFKQEYITQQSFNDVETSPDVYSIEKYANSWLFTTEDIEGEPLSEIIKTKPLSITDFLNVSIKLIDSLENIHQKGYIHKDINPNNIIMNKHGDIQIIDFGIASRLIQEVAHQSAFLNGTIAYMSPEQTGRMNRSVDYRSDFYSLGLTFYYMLSGTLPFHATDPMDLIYQHLAKKDIPLHQLIKTIPIPISDIIEKLLAKNAEDRYQTISGLKHDLEKCLDSMRLHGKISRFKIGQYDLSSRFSIPQKLYGRENDVALLLRTFDFVQHGEPSAVIISGPPGIGKSSLVNEIYKPVTSGHCYFLQSKFDEYEKNQPYLGLHRLIDNLTQQILTESPEEIAIWREQILTAVGANARILTDLAPSMIKIIGKQDKLAKVDSSAAETRFLLTMQSFFNVLDFKNPIVMFFDDMQWTDLLTLKVLESCITANKKSKILYILAYRDNEVNDVHPFHTFMKEIISLINVKMIKLHPLDLSAITHLLADTLHQDIEAVNTLAQLCLNKTEGNPFYLNLLLNALHNDGQIVFSSEKRRWVWNIIDINRIQVTDNVLDLILSNITTLAPPVQRALSIGACIGNSFDLKTIAQQMNVAENVVANYLNTPVIKNYIIPITDQYRYIGTFDEWLDINIQYQFSHDKIREAAYALLSSHEKEKLHYELGMILKNNSTKANLEKDVITILEHFNQSLPLIHGKLRDEMIALNLLAGRKAKTSQAYEQADRYFTTAIALSEERHWVESYQQMLDVYNEAAEMCALLDRPARLAAYIHAIETHAHDKLDLVKSMRIKIVATTATSNSINVLREGLKSLRVFGFNVSENPRLISVIRAVALAKIASHKVPIERIPTLHKMQDKDAIALSHLIHDCMTSSMQVNPRIFAIIMTRLFRTTIKFGLCEESSLACISFGVINCGRFKNFKKGYAYGSLGYQLAHTYRTTLPRAGLAFAGFINHTRNHYRTNLPILKEIQQTSYEYGNLEFLIFSSVAKLVTEFLMGKNLNDLYTDSRNLLVYADDYKQAIMKRYILIHTQALHNLVEKDVDVDILNGPIYHEAEHLPLHVRDKDHLAIFFVYVIKLIFAYYHHKISQAQSYVNKIKHISNRLLSHLYIPLYLFFDLLVSIRVYENTHGLSKWRTYFHIKKCFKELYKYAVASPNYLNKYYLALAEFYRVRKNFIRASDYYDKSLKAARENEFIHEEGLGNELAGRFYLAHGKDVIANMYLLQAYLCYQQWGSQSKMKQLAAEFLWLPSAISAQQPVKHLFTTSEMTHTHSHQQLDYLSIMKASLAVANEIALDNLISKTLSILSENIGADRCLLLLQTHGQLYIEGEYSNIDGIKNLLTSLPISQAKAMVPTSIIQYVYNTNQTIVIDDAHKHNQFTADSYLEKAAPLSIICVPLLHLGHLLGVIYCENRHLAGAFTEDRIEFLQVVSSQIGVSIKNAYIYKSLERFVPRQFLQLLGKSDVTEIRLGDSTQHNMSVFFADIRSFTSLTEKQEPKVVFKLLNHLLSKIEPIITKYNGFIDKYVGDAIMALFPRSPFDATQAAIEIQHMIDVFNDENHLHLKLGIGINTGMAMIGTLGSQNRMDGTVISDAVNVASRIETLTKIYGVNVLISDKTKALLPTDTFHFRYVDSLVLKGKSEKTVIWEVLESLPSQTRKLRLASMTTYTAAIKAYQHDDYDNAKRLFEKCVKLDPDDHVAQWYIHDCDIHLHTAPH